MEDQSIARVYFFFLEPVQDLTLIVSFNYLKDERWKIKDTRVI